MNSSITEYKNKDKAEQTKSEERKKPPITEYKTKDKAEAKTKSEEKKNELPPLPNIKKQDNSKKVMQVQKIMR